jgi:hypothetical protein
MKIMIELNDKVLDVIKSMFTKRNAIIGIVALFFIGGAFVFSQVITKPHDFSTGEVISAEEMNENFDALYAKVNELDARNPVFGYVPIGSIIAWHKSIKETLELPEGWVECNGQTIEDSESIFFNLATPDLNLNVYTGFGGRFLRGGTSSGIYQEATQVAVILETDQFALYYDASGKNMSVYNTDADMVTATCGPSGRAAISLTNFSNPADQISAMRVRPVNMSVVWIMRIK